MNYFACVVTLAFTLLIFSNFSFGRECGSTPILIDMGKDSFTLGAKDVGVNFDINADGDAELVQWVRAGGNEAFLVIDKNSNGLVDDGSELFGEGTDLLLGFGQKADDGYEALGQYDQVVLGGNQDGVISSRDSVWTELVLWLDLNADGFSSSDELVPISDTGIKILDLRAKKSPKVDDAGNRLALWSWAWEDLKIDKHEMVDVDFRKLD